MTADKELQERLNRLGRTLGQSPSIADSVMREIEVSASQQPAARPVIGRILQMKRIPRFAAAAVIVAAIAGLAAWLNMGNGGATVAWADVQEYVRNSHACSFTMTVQVEGVPQTEMKITAADGLVRQEISKPHKMVSVMDLRSGKALSLQEGRKKAYLMDISGLPKEAAERFQEQDMMRKLKEVIENPGTELGEKEIDGRLAKGYRVEESVEGEGKKVVTVWADAKTGAPIDITVVIDSGSSKVIMSDFEFHVEFEEGLFSMEPPEGYELVEHDIELKEPAFEDVAVLLRVMAKMNEGQFPDALPEGTGMGAYTPHLKGFDAVLGEKEAFQVVMPMGRGIMFLANEEDADVRYTGKGVPLGDGSKPVLWYRPADSQTCRVIYGDLSVKDMSAEDLPVKAP